MAKSARTRKTKSKLTRPLITRADEASFNWYGPNLLSHLVGEEATSGNLGLIQFFGQPGGEPPLHIHSEIDEFYYVLDGDAYFECGGLVYPVEAGSFVWCPRNITHGFVFQSSLCKILVGFTPGLFESWFEGFNTPAELIDFPPAAFVDHFNELDRLVERNKDSFARWLPADATVLRPTPTVLTKPFVAYQNDAETIYLPTMTMKVLCRSDQTAGALTVVENRIYPGISIPLHIKSALEVSYVLEGTVRFQLGDDLGDFGPGTSIVTPAHMPNGYRNVGSGPCRVLHLIAGGDFDEFCRELQPLRKRPETTFESVCDLLLHHNITGLAPEIAG